MHQDFIFAQTQTAFLNPCERNWKLAAVNLFKYFNNLIQDNKIKKERMQMYLHGIISCFDHPWYPLK